MTKQQFELDYCKSSGITEEFYNRNFVTLPCQCDADNCHGWAAVRPDGVKDHLELYVPDNRKNLANAILIKRRNSKI